MDINIGFIHEHAAVSADKLKSEEQMHAHVEKINCICAFTTNEYDANLNLQQHTAGLLVFLKILNYVTSVYMLLFCRIYS